MEKIKIERKRYNGGNSCGAMLTNLSKVIGWGFGIVSSGQKVGGEINKTKAG